MAPAVEPAGVDVPASGPARSAAPLQPGELRKPPERAALGVGRHDRPPGCARTGRTMSGLRGSAAPGPGATSLAGEVPDRSGLEEVREGTYELRGTWTFVTWGSMVTIALVPFTNVFLPGTDRVYSVMSVTQLFFW